MGSCAKPRDLLAVPIRGVESQRSLSSRVVEALSKVFLALLLYLHQWSIVQKRTDFHPLDPSDP